MVALVDDLKQDGVVRLSRHILCVGVTAVHTASIGRQCEKFRVNIAGRRVAMLEVTVNIGALDFAPLAIFLHQSEESWKFRLILIAPLFEQNHRHIIGSLFIRSSSLEDRQTEVFEQIIFKRLGATVFTDSHITNDEFSTKSLLKRVWSKVCPVLGDALTMLRWRVGGES